MSKLTSIFLAIVILGLSAAPSWAQETADPYLDVPMSRTADGGFVLGNPESGVKLIEFSDYLCPSCQNYEPLISSFIWDYVLSGQAQFEYRIFPVIDQELSALSASLVECADTLEPGLFWRAHDQMFDMTAKQGFTADYAVQFAQSLELDPEALSACAAGATQYVQDTAYGLSLGVGGTPALFVQYDENTPIQIALPLAEHFPAIVNAARPEPTEPVTIEFGDYAGLQTFRRADGGIVLGDADAPVTIVAFEDFLCPYCQRYAETVKQFIDEHVRSGKAQFEFRFYPIVNPQYSTTFVKLAECVAIQDLRLFWDAHDLLFDFAGSGSLNDVPVKLSRLLGLDADSLNICLDRSIQFLIDTHLGQSVAVSGTPAIRARENQGDLQAIFAGQQPQDRGGLPPEMLDALVEGDPAVSIGAPEFSLINDGFLQDTSLISGEPCAAPCWQSITPGETDMLTALAIVEAMNGISIVQAVDSDFIFRQGDGEPCCQITSRNDGKVESILLKFAPQMELQQVLSVFGEPDFVSGQPISYSEATIILYYPEFRLLLYVVVPGMEGQLEASSPLVSAVIATEDLFDRAFGKAPFDHWKGYLKYSDYMDGQNDYQP